MMESSSYQNMAYSRSLRTGGSEDERDISLGRSPLRRALDGSVTAGTTTIGIAHFCSKSLVELDICSGKELRLVAVQRR